MSEQLRIVTGGADAAHEYKEIPKKDLANHPRRLTRQWLDDTFNPTSASAARVQSICSYEG